MSWNQTFQVKTLPTVSTKVSFAAIITTFFFFFLLYFSLLCFPSSRSESRLCYWGYYTTAITPQDDYGAANGADLMDGTSEDVQPPCSLAIKSPLPCLHHIIHIQSYISSSRGVMTIRQRPMKSKTFALYTMPLVESWIEYCAACHPDEKS